MEGELRRRHHKRVYEKPRLRRIDLLADQVLGVGCKVPYDHNSFGPLDFRCGRIADPCRQAGS